jgi:hypothetical protein
MKRITIILFAVLATCHFSCNPDTAGDTSNGNTEESNTRGAEFEMVNVQTVGNFLNDMEGIDEMDGVVRGTVESVCKKKGCWMNVASEDGTKSMFVKFVDYGFFMPLDLTGQTITMKGTASKETTSVEELRHYAEDEGKTKEEIAAITEPKDEVQFMASGVVIREFKGAEFDVVNIQPVNEFVTTMATEGIDEMDGVVRGTVESVCKKKGCWMNVASEDGTKSMFVKFTDYGFFMPMDIAGKTVVMKGTATKEITSVDELKHYAEDEGKTKEEIEAITEPKDQIQFMAYGVVIGE